MDAGLESRLRELVRLVTEAPIAATTVRSHQEAWNLHILDSLTGLETPEIRNAKRICDIGAGAGLPGLALALALPTCQVTLIESVDKKVRLMERIVREIGIDNADPVTARAEEWSRTGEKGRESCDVVVARALAPLAVLVEYASPLLQNGGSLVAWKGHRDPQEEATAELTAEAAGMAFQRVQPVNAPPGADQRNLHLFQKVAETPSCLPRRSGMALKRPLIKK